MDSFIKQKAAVLLAIGKREEALKLVQDRCHVSEEQATTLLAALEAESAGGFKPGTAQIITWVGKGLALAGIIMVAVAIGIYASFINAKEDFIGTTGTVTRITDAGNDAMAITVTYTFNNITYTKSEQSSRLRELNLHEGQVLEIFVNPNDPNNTQLPVAEPIIRSYALNIGGVGLAMLLVAVVMWRFRGR